MRESASQYQYLAEKVKQTLCYQAGSQSAFSRRRVIRSRVTEHPEV